MERKFAILSWNKNNNVASIVDKLPANSKITIFYNSSIDQLPIANTDSLVLDKSIDTIPKARNAIIKFYKENETHANTTSFLHILDETVDILTPTDQFLIDIEYMMELLDVHSWFNTVNDPCNYVYSKYNPRLDIALDADCYKDLKLQNILFTSHANTLWTIYDIRNATDQELYLPEDYTIAMFYIIEYFATLRNSKKQGEIRYMNQYPTVKSEYKVFSYKKFDNPSTNSEEQNMQAEDAIFKQKKIDFHPDNNIDTLLEDVYNKLSTKIGLK